MRVRASIGKLHNWFAKIPKIFSESMADLLGDHPAWIETASTMD
jgi:hypothetical protein